MYYCKNLKFEDKPDYVYCKKLFKDLFNRQEFYKDFVWDWNVIQKAKVYFISFKLHVYY